MKDKIIERAAADMMIVIGALMSSFSVISILIPNDAIDYGTAGLAIIISRLTGLNLSLCVVLVFLPFWIAGIVVLGKQFGFRSLLGAIAYTLGLTLFESISLEINTEHFLAVAFGGAILGAGLSLILRFGGCIDGSEIFASILIKKIYDKTGKNFSTVSILLTFNILVYAAAYIYINPDSALLSLLVYAVASGVISRFIDHFESIKQVTIITKNPEALVRQIKKEMNKTCTIMDSFGAIAGENKTLICYVSYFELSKMKEIISMNKGAFSTVSTIDEILR